MLAGWIGTTGAATLLIRPLLRVNADRKYKTHILVFFIFLVANIGGLASPLGDPPLFIGFLEGIDFFWFIKHLYPFLLWTMLGLCFLFFIIDGALFYKDPGIYINRSDEPIFILQGLRNLWLIVLILLLVIFCNFKGEFMLFNENFKYASFIRNILFVTISLISLRITPTEIRQKNCFSLDPIKEVAELFAGIFITVTPIIYILHKGYDGELKFLFDWMSCEGNFIAGRCFWASGILSSMLDNAPTFLIFFHLTSGNAVELMNVKSNILAAISIATVFMGALTYIGNAPNLMVKSISTDYGVKAPSFIGYLLWSFVILIPIFFIISMYL
jgi:Na+/H+ antiporter NhaD/arsenite permease-like protein